MDIDITDYSFFVDHEERPFGNSIGTEDAVFLRDGAMGIEIRQDRKP
jgi:hypothetical protein